MAELTISTADIEAALKKHLEGLRAVARGPHRGSRPAGRRRHRPRVGPSRVWRQRAARVRGRHGRVGAEPRRGFDRRRRARRRRGHRRGPDREGHRAHPVGARRRRHAGPGRERPRRARRRQGPDHRRHHPPCRDPGAVHHGPQAGARADADRHQGHRRHDAHRPGSARADHRRPQDRQDHRRHRHDPEPEGSVGEVHLRRHRPEAVDGGPDRGDAAPARRDGVHRDRHRRRLRPGTVQVPRPVLRLRHGPAVDGERRARPDRLRRPLEAGRGLPPDVAAAAPPARPRGLPRRRLLPPLPPARAGGQALRRERRRLAHRAAHHRDQGRRRHRATSPPT